jgi:hypothetical protein
MNVKKLFMPKLTRSLEFKPASIDKANRTAELVWSVGAPVLRVPWFGPPFMEELSMDPAHCNLDRLNGGAPLLNSHNRYSTQDVIGVVEKAWIENGEGRAVVRFSKRDDVEPIWQDVCDGVLRNISIGYSVNKYEVTESPDQEVTTKRAVDYQPFEISIVPVGADAAAGFRSAEQLFEYEEVRTESANQQEDEMSKKNASSAGSAAPEETTVTEQPAAPAAEAARAAEPAATTVAPASQPAEAAVDQKARALEITKIVTRAKLDNDFLVEMLGSDKSVDQVRALVLDKVAERAEATSVRNPQSETVDANGGDAQERVLELAKQKRDADSKLGFQQSIRAVLSENKELAKKYYGQ